jgi:nitrile hydratase
LHLKDPLFADAAGRVRAARRSALPYARSIDGIHDMGGMHGFGEVVVPGSEDVFHADWERRVFVLNMLTGFERLRRNNGRATREEMEPARYLDAGYYERWLWSTERGLLDAGTIAEGEIEAWMERLRAGEDVPARRDPELARRFLAALAGGERLPPPTAPTFAVGDRVRALRMHPAGHTRLPRYLRGVTGVVDAVTAEDRLPDIPGDHPVEPVYTVRFASRDVFGDLDEPPFSIVADLWQSYLEADDG